MTVYDAVMAGMLIAGMVWGAYRGIIWQLASISSLVLGYTVSHQMSAELAPQLQQFGGPVVARALAMTLIYAAVSGGVFLAAWLARSTLRQLKFEAFDRHLGMIMGGIEGALLGVIGTLFVVSLAPQARASIFASPSGRIVGQVMNAVGPVLPVEVRQELAPYWNASGGMTAATDVGTGTTPAARSETEPAGNGGPSASPTVAKLQDLFEEGESRLGRAIVETAKKGLQPAANPNDGTVERR